MQRAGADASPKGGAVMARTGRQVKGAAPPERLGRLDGRRSGPEGTISQGRRSRPRILSDRQTPVGWITRTSLVMREESPCEIVDRGLRAQLSAFVLSGTNSKSL